MISSVQARACRCALALMFAAAAPLAPASATGPTCVVAAVSVALAGGLPATETIWTELCVPEGATTVHILQAGATYGHTHWDFPYQPETYSYVHALNAAGIATLNVDRLGIGNSSHPPSALVTVDANAYVLHRLVAGARAGSLGEVSFAPFESVVTVGNSLGSVIAVTEAATYADVDGVIITGAHKDGNAEELGRFGSEGRPAILDPRFEGRPYDPGYLTLPDAIRCYTFFSDRDRDCAGPVATLDNALKETTTIGEVFGAGLWVGTGESGSDVPQVPDTTAVRASVLIVTGEFDLVECGEGTDCSSAEALLATEASYYPNAASVDAYILPGAGHVINLASNAPDWFAVAAAWTHEVIS